MSEKLPKIKYTDDFRYVLDHIKDDSYVASEIFALPDSEYFNGLKIKEVDISESEWCFDVYFQNGSKHPMKIGNFVRYFFKDTISQKQLSKFTKLYNDFLSSLYEEEEDMSEPIEHMEFTYNPKNPRSTFLSLVSKTYPHGHEEEVLRFLPSLSKDSFGNYYKKVGESNVMFTCHLDTADRKQSDTKLFSVSKDGDEFIITDGTTILGADDKAGVTVLLYMIEHSVPGLYYFFIGEERGGIGSRSLAKSFSTASHIKGIEKCVSFDRRDYHSIITRQLGKDCCSDLFAEALCDQYSGNGLDMSPDSTGIYTDSASFMDDIPECTNVSVGYFNEHTGQEHQNISFLERLCEASVRIDWEGLPISRKTTADPEVVQRNAALIDAMTYSVDFDVKVLVDGDKSYLTFFLDEYDLQDVCHGVRRIKAVLSSMKMDPDIIIDDFYLKIELK